MLIFKPSNQEKKENNMRVVTSLLMLGLMTGVSANYASAQVHGAVEGVKVAAKSVDEVLELVAKTLHIELKTPNDKIEFAKKIKAENLDKLKKMTATEIAKFVSVDPSYKSLQLSYNATAKANAVAKSNSDIDQSYVALSKQGTQKGYSPSGEATATIWSKIFGTSPEKAKIIHSSLMQTNDGKKALEKIESWQFAFTRNIGTESEAKALNTLLEAEAKAALLHIEVTGKSVCANLNDEGLTGFANYVKKVVDSAKPGMTVEQLKAHMDDIYTKEFGRDGKVAREEGVCPHCPGTYAPKVCI